MAPDRQSVDNKFRKNYNMEGFHTPKNLTEWLTTMGYEGKIPTNLKPLCNPCTALIWEQLIQIVKPKQEIQNIRNNILINRLSRNDENCSSPSHYLLKHESKYPIKEIEVWNKKHKLEKQINALTDNINDAETKLNTLSNNNKMKYINLENIREKIQENEKFTFLLDAKSTKLETEVTKIEEMLNLARNLTPIESENQNKTEVLETLKKCSEKLEKIIEKQNETPTTKTNTSFMVPKTPHNKFLKNSRPFTSIKKRADVFTSTQISFQNKKKPKSLNDSLGLLDDLSMTFDDALAASSFKDSQFSNTNMCYDLAILNDQTLNDLIEVMLHKNDRTVIWNALTGLNELCKARLVDSIVENDRKNNSLTNLEKKDRVLMQLYATHVDYEVKTIKTDLNIQKVQQELNKQQEIIFMALEKNISQNRVSEVKDRLKIQQKEAGLVMVIQYLHKTVRNMRESTGQQDNLRIIQEKARILEENIISKLSSIENKLTVFKEVYDLMSHARNETCMLARKLGQFTLDANWTLPLSAHTSSVEICTFLEFPLEYNRTINIGGTKTFFRDLPINYVPYQEDFTSNTVHMLVTLLQNPCSPAETLLVNIMKAKLKMEELKALQYVPGRFQPHGYTLEQLKHQESYIVYVLEKLKSLIYNASTIKVMNISNQVRKVMDLWLEMPIKDFISPKRLFNGASYGHYEKLFENFYKQL